MARSKSGAVKSSSVLEVPSRRTKKARPQLYEDFDEQGSAGSDLLDSDELDDDFEGVLSPLKRKRVADRNSSAVKKASNRKRRKPAAVPSDDSEVGFELREGQEIAGKVIEAPQAGRVPPGQISQNTLDFLKHLQDPACNNREWFKSHEPVYKQAMQEWKDFVDHFTEALIEVDPQIPPLPAKDLVCRINRDIRTSNDATPYKTSFAAMLSRSGKKGIFASYYVEIKPGGESKIAIGSWWPAKQELDNIRTQIIRSPDRLRQVINNAEFARHFGEAKPPTTKGAKQNIFGMPGEAKTAPRGYDKKHRDIDLLRCRCFGVEHKFSDEDVLDPDFKEELARVAGVARPLVYLMNDMMILPADDTSP